MNKKLLLPAMMLAVAFTSCSNDDDATPTMKSSALGINVTVNKMSRAMVEGTALPDGSIIGVSVVETDGSDYDEKTTGYKNVSYTASTQEGNQVWTPTTDIMLSGTVGKAIAYYPYDGDASDYTAIEVDIADQEDWMWSGEETGLSDANATVSFELQHAQTAVNVNVVRDANYTGAGVVDALSVQSEGFAKTGTFSAVDGTWDNLTGTNEAIAIASSFTLDGTTLTSQENPYMLIPASAETKAFIITATLDDKPYNVTVNMSEAFAAGKVYKINVKMTNVGLTVDGVVVMNDWTLSDLGEGTLAPQ